MNRLLIGTVAVSLSAAGCNAPGERLDAPLHDRPDATADLLGTFAHMTDNALLADMTVGDMHFLPHRAVLNDLGRQRLNRLASLMDAYGGTIRFNTELTAADLIARRSEVIVEFLAQAGVDTTSEIVECEMPGGTGMLATEAILIKAEEATYKPKEGDESTTGKTITIK